MTRVRIGRSGAPSPTTYDTALRAERVLPREDPCGINVASAPSETAPPSSGLGPTRSVTVLAGQRRRYRSRLSTSHAFCYWCLARQGAFQPAPGVRAPLSGRITLASTLT